MKTIKYICVLVVSCIAIAFCAFCPVFAENYDTPEHFRGSTIEKKVIYKGALECYEQLAPTVALTSFGTGSTSECYATQGNTHYPVFTGRIGSILRDLNVGGSYGYRTCGSSSLRTWAKGIGKSNDVIPSRYDCESLLTSKVAVSAPNTTLTNSIEKERALEAIKYTSSNRQSADNHYCYSYPIEVNAVQTEVDPSSARWWRFMLHSRRLCTEHARQKVWTEGNDDYNLTPIAEYAAEDGMNETFNRNILQFNKSCSPMSFRIGDGIGNADEGQLCLKIDIEGWGPIMNNYDYVNIFEGTPYDAGNGNRAELNFLKRVGDKFREKIGGVQQPGHTETITLNLSDRTEKYDVKIYSPCNDYVIDGNVLKCIDSDGHEIVSERSVDPGTDTPSEETVYNKLATTTDANRSTIVKLFSGNQWNYNDSNNTNKRIKFTDEEIYELYTYYLENVYQISNLHCYPVEQNLAGLHHTKLWSDEQNGYSEYCYYDVSDENARVWGVDGDGFFGADVTLGLLEGQLRALQLSERPRGVIDENDEPIHPEEQFEGPDGCYAAGLENVAWIVCPTLNNITTAVDNIDRTLHTMLAIDAEQFSARGATETAWKYFRNLANIAMILVLIVIIASQVTGHGIDNYGIKKMLPKLIIMAILINLSFFICEIAVDVSNILGEGLNNMFQSIGRSVDTLNYGNITAGALVTAVFGGASLVGAGSTAIITVVELAAAGGGVMLVVSFILVLLAALIAVLVFLLMLAGRMVVIILFTVISPLAFVCYILPNTQPLFKKWWKIFYTMLVMYPICGALYGLSFVIRSIVLSSSSIHWWQAALAIIAPYIPFFALPTLLKSAIGALGAIGGVLTGMGGFLRRGIQTGAQNIKQTGAYKADSERAARNQAMWRAGVKYDKKTGEFKKRPFADKGFFKAIRGGNIGMSHARGEVMRNIDAIAAEKAGGGVDLLNSKQAEAEEKQFLASADAYAKQLSQGGKVEFKNKDGSVEEITNVSDQKKLGKYLNSLYRDWGAAKTPKDQREIMSKIVGVQGLMTGPKGATEVDSAMRDAIDSGHVGALAGARGAAYYYKQQNGQTIGTMNKSTDELMTNLAKDHTGAGDIGRDQNLHEALQKYNASTFAGAFSSEQDKYVDYANRLSEMVRKGGLDENARKEAENDLRTMQRYITDVEKSGGTITTSKQTEDSFAKIKKSVNEAFESESSMQPNQVYNTRDGEVKTASGIILTGRHPGPNNPTKDS